MLSCTVIYGYRLRASDGGAFNIEEKEDKDRDVLGEIEHTITLPKTADGFDLYDKCKRSDTLRME